MIVTPKYRGVTEKSKKLGPGVTAHFIENAGYFDRDGVYGDKNGDYPDNLERFAFFCRRALDLARERDFRASVAHLNEWQTALIAVDLKTRLAKDDFWKGTKTLFTIHNLAYQGTAPLRDLSGLGLPAEVLRADGLEFWGRGNLMKGGIVFSDCLNTVSPAYAKEILAREQGCGLDGALKKRSKELHGILNGIDPGVWKPSCSKPSAKAELQRAVGLKEDAAAPVFGMVSRLVEQKGFDLVAKALEAMMKTGLQLVVLATGDPQYHRVFEEAQRKHAGQFAAHLKFDAGLAEKIYAGSDFFLMPSRFEPCGLGQMIAYRYGTLPIVHKVGGLADTVRDMRSSAGTGFVFNAYKHEAMLDAVKRGLRLFGAKKRLEAARRRVIKLDFSWKKSAVKYAALYRRLAG